MRKIPVLFENDFCLILNKPSGLAVQGGEGVKQSLDSILAKSYSPRPLLVHRLDKDTSGIILVAKTKEAAAGFSELFAGRKLIKRYVGVCSGVPASDHGVINIDLDIKGTGQKANKKQAETFYKIISSWKAGNLFCSYLELEPGTGRMHQIRRHLAHIGIPLLGDDKYGNFSQNREFKKATGIKHMLLHASCLVIPSSPGLFKEELNISAPLPDYFPAV